MPRILETLCVPFCSVDTVTCICLPTMPLVLFLKGDEKSHISTQRRVNDNHHHAIHLFFLIKMQLEFTQTAEFNMLIKFTLFCVYYSVSTACTCSIRLLFVSFAESKERSGGFLSMNVGLHTGPCSKMKAVFPNMDKIRRSWDRFIFIMGMPALVRGHLNVYIYIPSPPPPPPPPSPHPLETLTGWPNEQVTSILSNSNLYQTRQAQQRYVPNVSVQFATQR